MTPVNSFRGVLSNNFFKKTYNNIKCKHSYLLLLDALSKKQHNYFVITCNFPGIIAQQPNMTAINSCIEVDLTGQISSDSIGTRFYSGFGGQVDFIRGAGAAYDGCGKPIIALQSTTKKGESKISPILKPGTYNHHLPLC